MSFKCLLILDMFKLLEKIKKYLFSKGSVYYINGNEVLKPPLSREEEQIVIDEYRNGSLDARNRLIEHNLRLVVYVAKRYDNNLFNLEDLISIGTLGLIKAINTFKCDKNIKLATYASRCIENEILMYLRKKARYKNEISLDEPLNFDYDGNELLLGDILSLEQEEVITDMNDTDDKEALLEAVEKLKPREQEILNMRFGLNGQEELTQKEVAELLGISQSYISRLEKKIIKKLKVGLLK